MNRFTIIKKTVKSYLVRVLGLGGETENRFISPKGLFSKPKDENGIVISMNGGNNQDVVIAIQKDIELKNGDVILTDDNNFIHFHFKDGTIEIKGDTTFDDNVTILKDLTVKGNINCDKTITAKTDVMGGGKSLKSHTHNITSGSSAGATTPPA